MKVYPKITGSLCANSHPGSYTGQDAFNDMLPVMEREGNDNVLCRERSVAQCDNAGDIKCPGLYARSANNFMGGVQHWMTTAIANMFCAVLRRQNVRDFKVFLTGGLTM